MEFESSIGNLEEALHPSAPGLLHVSFEPSLPPPVESLIVKPASFKPFVAIACGGTGGHLFPGLAVGEQLQIRGCDVRLLISPKEVDQQAVTSALGLKVATLPAVALTRGRLGAFLAGFYRSYRVTRKLFAARPPQAVLAMGGFTSAPPVLAGRACGAATFLHESNTIPGRANRWLAHLVTQAFVGFPSAVGRLHHINVLHTGTPVRPQFEPAAPGACRIALGLQASPPALLVTGGSQGASAINDLLVDALPLFRRAKPDLQFVHLTGPADVEKVKAAYALHGAKAVVRPFLTEMELALGAASMAVSRAGASSLTELAAMRLPSVLIPYPTAADNHQFFNARAFSESGAALILEQREATGERLASLVLNMLDDPSAHTRMGKALEAWDAPHAAELIADRMLALVEATSRGRWKRSAGFGGASFRDTRCERLNDFGSAQSAYYIEPPPFISAERQASQQR
jgi:UDP-N-acetylglucosamine--N-acetylmuramyl-(pentapeptide) pyrophosphoryl-undecaprenol N-acetylglucosamine transferase